MRRLVAAAVFLLLVLALTGCPWDRIIRAGPVPAQCDAMCYVVDKDAPEDTACASRARWEGNPQDPRAWEGLTQGTIPELRKETWSCGVRLRACQKCLDRLQKAGVILKP